MTYNFDEIVKRDDANCLKFDGRKIFNISEDVFPLWIADMDFKCPPCVKEAIIKRTEHLIFGYNYPPESYFDSVIHWMKERHGLLIEKSDICVFGGVVPALVLLLNAYLKKGDAVLIQPPVYSSFKSQIVKNEYKLIENPLMERNGEYFINFNDLESKIIHNDVKIFVLCSPHNPVCRVWKKEELEQIITICHKHNVIIISDEIHNDIIFPPFKHISTAAISEQAAQITITCTAPSKTFNLAGIKVSNILIKNEQLRQKFNEQCQRHDLVSLNSFAYPICESVYTFGEAWLMELVTYLKGNFDVVDHYLKQHLPQLKLIAPQATYLAWIDCRELKLTQEQLEDRILHKGKLWIEYGEEFGMGGEGFIRVNLATPRSNIIYALKQLGLALLSK